MSAAFKQMMEQIKDLSPDERALVAHCLILSLDPSQDEEVDAAWAKLSEARLAELKLGKVQGISWTEIKEQIKGQDG